MQSIKEDLNPYLYPYLNAGLQHQNAINLPFRNTIKSSSSALKNDRAHKLKHNVNTKFLRKNHSHSSLLNQHKQTSFEEAQSQANNYIALIKDPLWKHICTGVLNMMGPHAFLKMRNSQLGDFSSTDKMINIYCQSKEMAEFTQEYDFVILGSLQQYFPTCKKLRVIRKPH